MINPTATDMPMQKIKRRKVRSRKVTVRQLPAIVQKGARGSRMRSVEARFFLASFIVVRVNVPET